MASILVVDDEVGIRELLSEILGDEGHSVLMAENAARARDLRAREQIDLVLLDMHLPDIDGLEVLRRLRGGLDVTAGLLTTVAVTSPLVLLPFVENYVTIIAADKGTCR